jgi:DNA polymerase-4
VTRDLTLTEATDDPAVIRRAAGECLKRVPLERRLRLLGVRVGGLCSKQARQDENDSSQAELLLR